MATEEQMTLVERAHAVRTREDLAAFVDALAADHGSSPGTWENADLASYLEAMSGWVHDMDGYYANRGEDVSALTPWRIVADILMASRIYE